MKTKVGSVVILKLLPSEGDHGNATYEDVTENFENEKYENPEIDGTFIEVEVMRNFCVRQERVLRIKELD